MKSLGFIFFLKLFINLALVLHSILGMCHNKVVVKRRKNARSQKKSRSSRRSRACARTPSTNRESRIQRSWRPNRVRAPSMVAILGITRKNPYNCINNAGRADLRELPSTSGHVPLSRTYTTNLWSKGNTYQSLSQYPTPSS